MKNKSNSQLGDKMKIHELSIGDEFCITNYIGQYNLIGIFLGCDGMYGKVKWNSGIPYSNEFPFDLIRCNTEVEVSNV